MKCIKSGKNDDSFCSLASIWLAGFLKKNCFEPTIKNELWTDLTAANRCLARELCPSFNILIVLHSLLNWQNDDPWLKLC